MALKGMETKIQRFQDLRVWSLAHQLALKVYECTKAYPVDERYGITSQLRRAVVSIGANIAEGSKRSSTKDLCHFLAIAQGSNEEVKFLLLLSRDLHYLSQDAFNLLFNKCDRVGAMLHSLSLSLKSDH
jgi:four helix bundle protein